MLYSCVGEEGGVPSDQTFDVEIIINQIPDLEINTVSSASAADVQSVGIVVKRNSNGATLLTQELPGSAGSYTGSLLGLPAGILLDFEAKAYDSPALAGAVIFTAPVQQVTLTGPASLTFDMEATPFGTLPTLPVFNNIYLPAYVAVGANNLKFGFDIIHGSSVDYTIDVTAGTIDGVDPSTGTHNPAGGRLDVTYASTAPDIGVQSLTATLVDPLAPEVSVSVIVGFEVADTTSGITVRLGPAITNVAFIRTATDLTVTVIVAPGAGTVTDPTGYVWSGTVSSGAISGGSPSITFPFLNDDSGTVDVTVTDSNGLATNLSVTITLGDFPYNVTPEEPPPPYY